jgi:hypothetical protein
MDASPGMAYRDIAASAYSAYAESTGHKNFAGNPMPRWDALPQRIQTAWEAAIRQAEQCFISPETAPGTEVRWAGWVPPHLASDEGGRTPCP